MFHIVPSNTTGAEDSRASSVRRHPYYRKLNITGTRAGGLSITINCFNQLRQHSLRIYREITYKNVTNHSITHLICLRGCVDQRTLRSSYTPRRTLLDSNICSAFTVSHSEFLIPHIIRHVDGEVCATRSKNLYYQHFRWSMSTQPSDIYLHNY